MFFLFPLFSDTTMGPILSQLEAAKTRWEIENEGASRNSTPANKTTRTHLLSLSRATNKFAISLFQEFAKDGKKPGNVLFSPVGVALGIGMAYIGAEKNTHDEIYKAFYLHEVQPFHLLPAYAALHWDVLRSAMPKGCVMEAAIRMFAQMEHKMTNEYEEILTNYEISRIRHVDFFDRVDLARKEINKWVEDRTHGKIKDVLPLGYIDRDTKLFLISAMYLKAQWYHQFDSKKTLKMAFHLPMKETIEVAMMNQQNNFRIGHIQKIEADCLELPFSNGHMKMYVFLPKKLDGCNKIESKMSRTLIETIEDNLQEDYIEIFIPKFSFELGFSASETIQKVGIKEVFNTEKADLSGIDGSKDMSLWGMFHHIYFEIDETGNDSSSVTSVHDVGSFDIKPKRIFKADHPFVFYVRDERTGAVLIMGRAVRPQIA